MIIIKMYSMYSMFMSCLKYSIPVRPIQDHGAFHKVISRISRWLTFHFSGSIISHMNKETHEKAIVFNFIYSGFNFPGKYVR